MGPARNERTYAKWCDAKVTAVSAFDPLVTHREALAAAGVFQPIERDDQMQPLAVVEIQGHLRLLRFVEFLWERDAHEQAAGEVKGYRAARIRNLDVVLCNAKRAAEDTEN